VRTVKHIVTSMHPGGLSCAHSQHVSDTGSLLQWCSNKLLVLYACADPAVSSVHSMGLCASRDAYCTLQLRYAMLLLHLC
jgi:hypothetical protein